VIANSLWSLCGISFALAALHFTVVPFGAVPALAALLAIPVTWNLAIWLAHRRAAFALS
jgi:hypothetical protein